MGLAPNVGDVPIPTFGDIQDDCIATGSGVSCLQATMRSPVIAQVAEGGFHEMLLGDFVFPQQDTDVVLSRRKLRYDKSKLQCPAVMSSIKRQLVALARILLRKLCMIYVLKPLLTIRANPAGHGCRSRPP